MSNHFHLVVYYDPKESFTWSEEEVVDRWLSICPPRRRCGEVDTVKLSVLRQQLLFNPEKIYRLRTQLGSQSVFMQLLKQPIARRANIEDKCTGHFFEQRFYSGALLSEDAILAAMAYVDLNPIRAGIAGTLEASKYTSIASRLRNHQLRLPIRPLVSGLIKPRFIFKLILADYVGQLRGLVKNSTNTKAMKWRQQVALIRRRQRAFGSKRHLKIWLAERDMKLREVPLP